MTGIGGADGLVGEGGAENGVVGIDAAQGLESAGEGGELAGGDVLGDLVVSSLLFPGAVGANDVEAHRDDHGGAQQGGEIGWSEGAPGGQEQWERLADAEEFQGCSQELVFWAPVGWLGRRQGQVGIEVLLDFAEELEGHLPGAYGGPDGLEEIGMAGEGVAAVPVGAKKVREVLSLEATDDELPTVFAEHAHNGLATARQYGRVPRPLAPGLRGLCAARERSS